MKKLTLIMIMGIAAFAVIASDIPTRGYIDVTNSAAYAAQVDSFDNGQLARVRIHNCTPTNAVLTVTHVYTLGSSTVTGTVTTVTGNLSGYGTATISAEYDQPRDYYYFKFASATTGTVEIVRLIPK
ncbi:MAG: hypothetical protein PF904_10885 [Kiritimatiellae bacterium]|jgi:hypothetical protein|nr:hypothetical protein [Kiritimatiellia bacterium]